ncbi:Sulfatase family protein [Trichomonas vaginalis G3]|uniref:Sulfatase family protein n=1 Tax=Trichomonas vaginalis (strain ATCC PRA-98 / G3) TaxID=412133 RepID=A2GI58_TRIV3|nr:lipoteichoic acid synthase family [Trichomonas vaginalis G3]EAX83159.1 Sulfatase family protein [Trichomonas vaginalis G3]KAI5539725.1 lipoteichoic acid synthase family [Trichomonas vaginalis G3]|eukprot:XP_001296089.1 Sulfatase family protein [Trichomonas vaginalis G3]
MFESFAVCILSSLAIGFIKNIYQLSGSIYFDELKELIIQREYAGKTEFIYSFSTNYFLPALLPSLYIFYAFIKYSRSTLYIRYINININLDYRMLSIINIFFVVVAFYSTIKTTGSSSLNFYNHNYVFPNPQNLVFPEKKKNVIFISLESFESSFISQEHGGLMETSYSPYIESLALDTNNVHFSNHTEPDKLGGTLQLYRNRFTVSANFAVQCGFPFKWQGDRAQNKGDNTSTFYYTQAQCLGDVLKKNGYDTHAIYGTFDEDWSIGFVFKHHGFDHCHSSVNLANKRWFVPDHVLFKYQKDLIDKIYKENPKKPFLLYITSIDTHEPGYICKLCPPNGTKLQRLFNCLSNQIKDLLDWMKTKPWYNDTLIVLHGDHVRRDTSVQELAQKNNYPRRIFNVFINSELKRANNTGRVFTHFDMFPTILAAAGVKIKGDKLGLGVNLFSGKKTLLEKFSQDFVDENLESVYNWYQKVFHDDGALNCFDRDDLCVLAKIYPEKEKITPKKK